MGDNQDLYQKIVSQRSGLAWLTSKLPGFGGYMEMNARRTADRMIREHIASQFEQRKDRLISLERKLISAGALSLMDDTKSLKTKLQTLIDRIATDAPGYSGFFAINSIGPDELENIYAFDEAMIRYADDLDTMLDTLEAAVKESGDIEDAVYALDNLVIEANTAYDLRDDLVGGIA